MSALQACAGNGLSKRTRREHHQISSAAAIGAVFVITWGMVLLGLLGLTPLGFGLSGQLVHYGVSIQRGDTLAVPMGWSATAAMGVVTLQMGVTPVTCIVWLAFFVLSLSLNFGRDALGSGD